MNASWSSWTIVGRSGRRFDRMDSSTPLGCGGGARCPNIDAMTFTLYTPAGALGPARCHQCARRLGWIDQNTEIPR